jgi:hypothetical protein
MCAGRSMLRPYEEKSKEPAGRRRYLDRQRRRGAKTAGCRMRYTYLQRFSCASFAVFVYWPPLFVKGLECVWEAI